MFVFYIKLRKFNKVTYVLFVSFRSVRNLRSHLVRAKVDPVREGLAGTKKCNKNLCQVFKNLIETETFQSFVDKKVYKIVALHVVINVCSTSCRVKVCGMQYNNRTNDKFRYR